MRSMTPWACLIERRRVEFHDAIPNGLLVDALVQWLELSPELHQIAAARVRVHPHVCCRDEGVSWRVPMNLTLIWNVLLEIDRVDQRQKEVGKTS